MLAGINKLNEKADHQKAATAAGFLGVSADLQSIAD
jgi:hypothetical protein